MLDESSEDTCENEDFADSSGERVQRDVVYGIASHSIGSVHMQDAPCVAIWRAQL